MLGFLAVAFSAGIQADLSSHASLARGAAGRAAESGLEYAAARLREKAGYPVLPRLPGNRSDDWSFRDGPIVPAARAQNPSWARGEGIPGAGSWTDLDGDGRFSAWSGRLRGGEAPFADRFSLKVDSTGGKIPVNTWTPSGRILDGAALQGLLDNLGARLLPDGHPRRFSHVAPGTSTEIPSSHLGNDLFRVMPAGGYADPSDIAAALAGLALPGGGPSYPAGPDGLPLGFAQILPHITCAPGSALSAQFDDRGAPLAPSATAPAIELATASREVLEAVWRHIARDLATGTWWPAAADAIDPVSSLPFSQSRIALLPEDAETIARETVRLRDTCLVAGQAPDLTGLYRRLLGDALALFPSPGSLGGFPVEAARYAQSKADLAFLAVSPDASPFTEAPPLSLATWGIPRQREEGNAAQVVRAPDINVFGINRLAIGDPPGLGNPFRATGTDSLAKRPAFLTGRPPVRFEIFSSGSARGTGRIAAARDDARGILDVSTPLFLGSQRDLEGVYPSSDPLAGAWFSFGNDVTPPLADARRRVAETVPAFPPRPAYRQVASLPAWDHGSYPSNAAGPFTGYSSVFGALTPAGFESGPRNAAFYWPFSEVITGVETFASENTGVPPIPPPPPLPWQGMVLRGGVVEVLAMNPGFVPTDTPGQAFFTPYGVTGGIDNGSPASSSPPLDVFPANQMIPGLMSDRPASRTGLFVAEGWIAPGLYSSGEQRAFRIAPLDNSGGLGREVGEINLFVQPEAPDVPRGVPGLTFRIEGTWSIDNGGLVRPVRILPPPTVTIRSETARNDFHFVRLQIEYIESSRYTWITLYVDDPANYRTTVIGGQLAAHPRVRISVTGMDDLRLYGHTSGVTGMPLFQANRDASPRFTRRGSYVSPRYTLKKPGRIRHAQWNGIVPTGSPWPIRVQALLYEDAGGTIPLPSAPGPIDLGPPGSSMDLSAFGKAGSFRYLVDFSPNASPGPGPLGETTRVSAFESIEFVCDRPPSPKQWIRYE